MASKSSVMRMSVGSHVRPASSLRSTRPPYPIAIARLSLTKVTPVNGSVERRTTSFQCLPPSFVRRMIPRSPAASAQGNHVLSIEYVQSVERVDQTGRWALPTEAATGGVKNDAVRADSPATELVAGETNRADRISLRQRVLPFPTTTGGLRADHSAN